ncbi:toll/interleukin-1 receptor domain-containing protein [Actinosynnema sp. NPDC050436]|uniref:toll/interleukin-1 receptor domain-containing protein n=1 Tax=Actinosynnema sp. NPDC050436 TaxID=3155659 RepID=UPI0033F0F9F6
MNVFVSYSRRDFYAAEALASVLAASGEVETWLDVEHLVPGTDWSSAIDTAIDQADVVVVVASPAAMASEWVTQEWKRALANGTPVHVALVRDTELPSELALVHDLRGRFFTEARRMVEVLLGRAAPGSRRRFPLSPQVALLWLSLLFCTVIAGVGATLGWDLSVVYRPVHAGFERIGLATALANVLVGAGLVAVMVRLFRRTASPSSLREAFARTGLSLMLSLVGTLIVGNGSYREAAGPDARTDSAWLYLAAGAVALFAFVLVSRSRVIHLEMPTGRGDDHIRARFKGHRTGRFRMRRFAHMWAVYRPRIDALKQVTGVGSAATYRVWSHPGDKPFANVIAGTCEAAGFAKDEVDPRWVFIVVSTRTPAQAIRYANEVFGDRVVFVLTTSLPSLEDRTVLRRYQWLDFREQQPEGLYEFLRAVVTGEQGERGVVTVPMGVDSFRAPRYITNYLVFGQVLIGLAAAPPLGLLLAGDFARAVPVVLVTALLAAAVVNLIRRTADRTITAGGWSIRSVLVLLLFIAWLVLAPALPHIPPVNRIVLALVVVASLFGSTKVLLSLWLPPEEGQKVRPASPPVTPPWYAFSVPLMSLVLATGYFFVTQP